MLSRTNERVVRRDAASRASRSIEREHDQHGLYGDTGAEVFKIIDRDDLLDGRQVEYFVIGPESLEGQQLAFAAYYPDRTSALYIATIPEPSAAAGLLAAILGLIGPRRRGAG
jgi:hypothetical protein